MEKYVIKKSEKMVYEYYRTSIKEQHLDCGIVEIIKYCQEHNLKTVTRTGYTFACRYDVKQVEIK